MLYGELLNRLEVIVFAFLFPYGSDSAVKSHNYRGHTPVFVINR